ncbi:LysM peptidoglycan-binding domain-containing protein [bacterium]|nr:LysM peptidoglycan-binding domain-containing protein [bacterium]
MDRRKREIFVGHLSVLLIVVFLSGCGSNIRTVSHKPRIKDSFARVTMPQPFYTPRQPAVKALSNMPSRDIEKTMPVLNDKIGRTNYTTHFVSKGETLYSIGKKYNVSYYELASLNNISDVNDIKVGQRLRVPGTHKQQRKSIYTASRPKKSEYSKTVVKKETKSYKPVAVSAVRQTTTYAIHVVQQGETLYNIAKKYDVRKKDICSINGISDNVVLRQGQRIKIPVE